MTVQGISSVSFVFLVHSSLSAAWHFAYPFSDDIFFQQDPEPRSRTHGLTHHLSLPKTSIEMANIEKFLQFQGSVPCKIRAKRGFATHPRSIAERVNLNHHIRAVYIMTFCVLCAYLPFTLNHFTSLARVDP